MAQTNGTQATEVRRWRVVGDDGTYAAATVEREGATVGIRTRLGGDLTVREAGRVAAALFTAAGLTDEDVDARTRKLAQAARDVADGITVLVGEGDEAEDCDRRLEAFVQVLRGALLA